MAAFSASRLVCRAISSMIDIFSAISFIALTVAATATLLSCASVSALSAICSVACAFSAFCLVEAFISSTVEEASSAVAACSVAPCDSCSESAESCWLAAATVSDADFTPATIAVQPRDHRR